KDGRIQISSEWSCKQAERSGAIEPRACPGVSIPLFLRFFALAPVAQVVPAQSAFLHFLLSLHSSGL
ncbi:hypothetical protein P4E94_18060, partial [Pontiellaceae bacterium B12219]|nr:hypothetical protein [Pontiellaceae bacterium B12219]